MGRQLDLGRVVHIWPVPAMAVREQSLHQPQSLCRRRRRGESPIGCHCLPLAILQCRRRVCAWRHGRRSGLRTAQSVRPEPAEQSRRQRLCAGHVLANPDHHPAGGPGEYIGRSGPGFQFRRRPHQRGDRLRISPGRLAASRLVAESRGSARSRKSDGARLASSDNAAKCTR